MYSDTLWLTLVLFLMHGVRSQHQLANVAYEPDPGTGAAVPALALLPAYDPTRRLGHIRTELEEEDPVHRSHQEADEAATEAAELGKHVPYVSERRQCVCATVASCNNGNGTRKHQQKDKMRRIRQSDG